MSNVFLTKEDARWMIGMLEAKHGPQFKMCEVIRHPNHPGCWAILSYVGTRSGCLWLDAKERFPLPVPTARQIGFMNQHECFHEMYQMIHKQKTATQ